MNILDYVDFRGDILFTERPLNEVDNLIFSELSYLELASLFGDDLGTSFTISELCKVYEHLRDGLDYPFSDPWPLLEKCAGSARFGDVRVKYFVNEASKDLHSQFAAVTFIYGDGRMYVAFRGTDGNIEGWREGFSFSYLDETEGQRRAVEYLNMAASREDGEIIVGGHSKGGNFAEYAAAYCDEAYRDRIKMIYSNDGPGFINTILDSDEYKAILPKTLKIMPEASIVGSILAGDETLKVIKGTAKGLIQHDPFYWSVRGTEFESSSRKGSADFIERTLSSWVEGMEGEERQQFTDAVFEALEDSGISSLADLHKKSFRSIFAINKARKRMDPDKAQLAKEGFRRMRRAAIDNLLRKKP